MTCFARPSTVLFLCLAACAKDPAVSPADAGVTPMGADATADVTGVQPGAEQTYVLDFSGSVQGGKRIGRFRHIAFTVQLDQPTRAFVFDEVEEVGPGLVASDDMATCELVRAEGAIPALERTTSMLPKGDNAFVSTVDLEILRAPNGPENNGGVCFGYRQGGAWKWELRTHSGLNFDRGQNRFTARVNVDRGPIDAVKLVFDDNVAGGYVSKIRYVARGM